jgi:hypothetical protein
MYRLFSHWRNCEEPENTTPLILTLTTGYKPEPFNRHPHNICDIHSFKYNTATNKKKVSPRFNKSLRHEDIWVHGGIASRILNLGTELVEISGPFRVLINMGNSPQYQLDTRPVGSQYRSGSFREKKNILHLPGIESRILFYPFYVI